MAQELHLDQELKLFEERLQVTESQVQLTTQKSVVKPAIDNFQDFLARHGGHTGGWEPVLHQAFLRMRNKYGVSASHLDFTCIY